LQEFQRGLRSEEACFVGQWMASGEISDAADRTVGQSRRDGDAGETAVLEKLGKAAEHGICGFAESDYFDFRKLGEVVGAIVDDQGIGGAEDTTLHRKRDIDGRQRL